MILSKPSERLYLHKDDGVQDIYVNLHKTLAQHQIDGIRFLYRQFKKKTPGVIVNDPAGYGKCLQVALFVNAIRPLLKKPVLILTDNSAYWKGHFQQWTECCDDISINTSNPYAKKHIHIAPINEGLNYGRRSWSIVVLHDQGAMKELLAMSFNADYQIWITSRDLKENLRMLASIYEWLYPNHRFNVEDFSAEKGNWRDMVQKAILLDAFSEDFLTRNTNVWPANKPESIQPASSPVKASRKNKDPTGTKVKRSKRMRIEDEDETNVSFKYDATKNIDNTGNKHTEYDFTSDGKSLQDIDKESFQNINVELKSKDLDFAIQEIARRENGTENITDEILNNELNSEHEMSHYEEIKDTSKILVSETEDEKYENTNGLIKNETVILETENSESQTIFQSMLDEQNTNNTQNCGNWDVSDIIKTVD